jgi:asparagine synthase (glutamine-hydrolysing)
MCGINGIVSLAGAGPIDREELLRTREAMAARGPDGAGAWVSADGRVGLASRRLAILDLSPAGAQPMASDGQAGAAAGAVQVVLNGEIYNFRELRAGLEAEGYRFRGHSDTEVVLALYLRHGEALLPLLRGMFGLAIWDGHRRRLLLARDPLGIKPLYYSAGTAGDGGDGAFRFASQVKALDAGGAISPEIDPAGLAGFLLWGSVPEPWTIRRAVRALPAGHALAVEYGRPGEPRPFLVADPEPLAPETAIEESVAVHLVSDVPVAVFLSAGLDSGLLAALARRHLPEPPATFTLRFDVLAGTPADEAPLAAEVARALGTRHVEHRMGREDFARLWPAALAAMDQPSIDGFNTFAVSRAAHEAGLKVVLSGLGGDEIFGSYPSFIDVPRGAQAALWARRLPGLENAWPALAARLAPGRPKLAGLLAYGGTLPGSYFLRRGLFLPGELPGLLGKERAAEALALYDPIADAGKALAPHAGNGHGKLAPWVAVHRMETAQYMRNQLLRDSDWASMASSVELRVPLVDAWLTQRLAAHGFAPARESGKAALVRRLAPELPAALFHRPKTGFYIPVVEWMLPGGAAPATPGGRSRALALRVLAEVGVELAA